jgi:hypothetical protein
MQQYIQARFNTNPKLYELGTEDLNDDTHDACFADSDYVEVADRRSMEYIFVMKW